MEGLCDEKLDVSSLHLDFSEVDEEEFNIPNNTVTPTLESILNEEDDEVTNTAVDFQEGVESTPSNGGEILRHIVLRSVSTQLCSACDRVNAGRPTVMCVSSMICVGTSHGLVLGFDSSQQLKWCHEGELEQGAVTALGLNVDCTRLLAGYARGIILMFNVTEAGKVIRRMTDVHSPSSGVLHVKFTDSSQMAVCSDTGGSVFQLNFKRTLGVRSVESKCLFSGSRGEVCAIEPLILSNLSSHPLHGSVILAMATLSKVIIVSIKPTMRVLLTRSVSVSPMSLPLLSWQFVIIQVSEKSRIMDPVLAFARGNTVYFFQVCVNETGKALVSMLQQVRVEHSIMSCHWMNPRLLVTLDTNEVLHLLEVRSKAELESVDLSAVRLVYNSSHFKGRQYKLKGRAVNVPTEVRENVKILPRLSSETQTIPVALKRSKDHKTNVLYESIRPEIIFKAADALEHCEVFKYLDIKIDKQRFIDDMNKTMSIDDIRNDEYDDVMNNENIDCNYVELEHDDDDDDDDVIFPLMNSLSEVIEIEDLIENIHSQRSELIFSSAEIINENYDYPDSEGSNYSQVSDVNENAAISEFNSTVNENLENNHENCGLSTGGNVSQAMALAGERACYNTVQSFGNQLLLLGIRSLHVLTIRSWDNRLDVLVEQNKYIEAIRLGVEFMEEKNKIAFGLIGSHADRHTQVRTKVLGILDSYIAQLSHWRDLDINVICQFCVDFGLEDKMWNQVWRSVEHITSSRNIFLSSVEVLLVKEKVTQVPADVMQQLLLHQDATGRYSALELSVLCVNIDCLDIELVLRVSKERSLYDAFISVWNRAMGDYVTPLQVLLPQLATAETQVASSLGNKLLVYISCCLSGRGYPRGEIEEAKRAAVRQQVCQCLCMQHTPNAPENELSYPYLRTLLKFNTREFLNALAIAQLPSSFQQRLFDVLISITLDSEQQYLFKPSQVGYVFAFISRNLTRGITVEDKHLQNVLHLLTTSCQEDLESRQDAFLEVVTAKDLLHQDSTLEMARAAEFYKVCSVLHEERGEHSLLLKCLLLDNTRKARVFDFVAQSSHKDSLEHFIVENIAHFVEVNGHKSGAMVQSYYSSVFEEALNSLPEQSKFHYLQGGMEVGDLSTGCVTKYIQLCCQYEPDLVLFLVRRRNDFKISSVLESVRQFQLEESEAVLLEKSGDFQGAFDILFRRLQVAIQSGVNIEAATESVVVLGQAAGDRLNAQTTWLPLLQCLHRLESHETLKRILSCPNLNLASEFHLLLKHTSGRLGDFRTLIIGLFEKCKHEQVILQSSLQSLRSDLHDDLANTLQDSKRGFLVHIECGQCKLEYALPSKLVAFRCGHSFHHECTSAVSSSNSNAPVPLICNLCTT